MAKFVGVILAGGRSTRMGNDKSLLDYKGLTFVEHLAKILEIAGASEVYISGQYYGHCPTILDEYPNLGPLGGIYSVLKSNPLDAVFVPVDMPLLQISQLKKLTYSKKEICHYIGFPFPLYVKNTLGVNQYLANVCESNQANRSVKGFIDYFHSQTLDVKNSQYFANINTQKEYQQLTKSV